ncbi:hypothetical protein EDD21DRAFT_350865 [Dissophora ornata]|nr:hypothetical protein EDD21DRAFT_350865 [Dissophora ornata]
MPFLPFNPPLQHSVMNKINPLELPEIRLSIAEHLKKPDLVRCLRVCWSWHDTFLPLVWENLSVDNSRSVEQDQDAFTPEVLRSHCHLVTDLYIADWSGNYPLDFPRIQTLDFHLDKGYTPFLEKYLAPLIRRNQSLVKLHVRSESHGYHCREWEMLLELPHLRELSLRTTYIHEDGIVRFWIICENLESLILEGVLFPEGTTPHAPMCFRNIRKLVLSSVDGMEVKGQFRFISACPNLEDLAWSCSSIVSVDLDNGLEDNGAMGGTYFNEFAKDVGCKRWPRLTSLKIDGQWTEEDTCLIIEGMQRVKKINLENTFGPLTFQVLQRHFNNLVELRVETSSEAASKLLQNIMCSCPALKRLQGGSVLAKDVVEGKPWVCLSLETLIIFFMFSDTEQHLQPLVFECLAKLTRLEDLYCWAARMPFHEKYPVPLQFRLQSGLDALSGLWRMASFFPGYDSSLSEEEVRWMLVHWKELVSVTDVNIDDPASINLLKSRGIELCRF